MVKKTKNKEALEAMKNEKDGKKKDWRIYGVKKKNDFLKVERDLPRPLHTMLEKGGGCLQIFSAPGSGKSNMISNLFLRESLMKDLFEGGLYLVSPTATSDLTSEALCDYADFVETEMTEEILEGIYSNIMSVKKEDRLLTACIFDDCMGSRAMRQHTLLNKMVSANRHMKCLFVFSSQSVKSINPNLRSCASHTIIFYTPSQKQFNDLVELHAHFGGEEQFINDYKEATTPKYGFYLADWRDQKSYAWGAELPEPKLLWSRYDDNGNVIDHEKREMEEPNKGLIKSSD
tara:strand:- start:233 stop:1099 length:867 start_codon:yes stop_codon:yes gene_type:complete